MADSFKRGESPENLGFSIYRIIIPSLITSAPEADITSSGGYKESIQAAALSHSVSLIARSQKLERALEPAAWDMFFKGFCGGVVESGSANMNDLTRAERHVVRGRLSAIESDAEDEDEADGDDEPSPRATATPAPELPPQWPRFRRLKTNECGWDTRMGSFDERRLTFHQVVEDRDVLLERAKEDSGEGRWIVGGIENAASLKYTDGSRAGEVHTEANDYIQYYVVYVPGGKIPGIDPGRNQPGTIHTIAGATGGPGQVSGMEIREPYYWTGHPDGLHFFEGQYTTGANSHFLSLLAANEDAMQMLEAVSASIHQRIRDHKVVHVHDVMASEAMEQVIKAPHGGHVGIPGLSEGSGMLQTIETDALTSAEYQSYAMMQANSSRQMGIDESGQGNASPNATATAVSVANNATRSVIEYLIGRWNRFVSAGLERTTFEVAMSDHVVVRMNEDGRAAVLRAQLQPLAQQGVLPMEQVEQIVDEQKMHPMLIQGGDFADEDEGLDWFSMNVSIRPFSMEGSFGNAQLAREAQWNQQLSFLLQMVVQQPHGRWVDRIRATGRAMGMRDADMVVDMEIANQIAQLQIAKASNQPVTGGMAAMQEDDGPATMLGGSSEPRMEV